MEKKSVVLFVISLVSLVALLLTIQKGLTTGFTLIELKDFSITDNLEGTISLTIEESDSIRTHTPILIALSKNNTIIKVKTLTFKEFIEFSNNPIQPTINPSDSNYYYKTPSTHKVKIQNLLSHQFTEKGEYELLFNILELDLTIKKQIIVD